MKYSKPEGRTMAEAIRDGDWFHLEDESGHTLAFPGACGLDEALFAASVPAPRGAGWAGRAIAARLILPGSRIGCMLLGEAVKATVPKWEGA